MDKEFIFEKDSDRVTENPIPGFACLCRKCGSADVTLGYMFRYYSLATGYDQEITLHCRNCGNNTWSAPI